MNSSEKKLKNPVLFIVGPTAVGKSEIALRVAGKLQGEIVSADSMQIYRGMDIGTGKPSAAQQRKIRHHLLDICAPSRLFSVYDYHRRALKAILEIHSRERLPIVTGGSGLYIRALLQGLDGGPSPDFHLRRELEALYCRDGIQSLVKRLQQAAPEKAAKMDLANKRRVIRALEVHSQGQNKTRFEKSAPSLSQCDFSPIVIGLRRDREVLYRMIENRIDQMFRKGWIQEAENLSQNVRISRTAKQALGYRHLFELFKMENWKRVSEIKILKALVKRDTRRFAKRQMTWFRREENLIWIDWLPECSAAKLTRQICDLVRQKISNPS